MKKWIEKRFEKWETKTRIKMGDEAFLQKYSKAFKWDKILKNLFLFNFVGGLVNAVLYSTNGRYSFALCWLYIALSWGFICYGYFCQSDLHKRKTEEWKKELDALNTPPVPPREN